MRATCLYLATKLGDLMEDLVVVGGLVPSLLIEQDHLSPGMEAHAGTMDLDVGIALAMLDGGRYRTLTERLRRAGFSQDATGGGRTTRQRWTIAGPAKITVDFLIQPSRPEDRGGSLRDIESGFAAIIVPGLHLAFRDRVRIPLAGRTILGEAAEREVGVCGPGAYVVLKSLAFDSRGENKDAYDLFYLVRNYGAGPDAVASHLEPIIGDPLAVRAVEILKRDFLAHDGLGPRRVAAFLTGAGDDEIQADVAGFVGRLVASLPKS